MLPMALRRRSGLGKKRSLPVALLLSVPCCKQVIGDLFEFRTKDGDVVPCSGIFWESRTPVMPTTPSIFGMSKIAKLRNVLAFDTHPPRGLGQEDILTKRVCTTPVHAPALVPHGGNHP